MIQLLLLIPALLAAPHVAAGYEWGIWGQVQPEIAPPCGNQHGVTFNLRYTPYEEVSEKWVVWGRVSGGVLYDFWQPNPFALNVAADFGIGVPDGLWLWLGMRYEAQGVSSWPGYRSRWYSDYNYHGVEFTMEMFPENLGRAVQYGRLYRMQWEVIMSYGRVATSTWYAWGPTAGYRVVIYR